MIYQLNKNSAIKIYLKTNFHVQFCMNKKASRIPKGFSEFCYNVFGNNPYSKMLGNLNDAQTQEILNKNFDFFFRYYLNISQFDTFT